MNNRLQLYLILCPILLWGQSINKIWDKTENVEYIVFAQGHTDHYEFLINTFMSSSNPSEIEDLALDDLSEIKRVLVSFDDQKVESSFHISEELRDSTVHYLNVFVDYDSFVVGLVSTYNPFNESTESYIFKSDLNGAVFLDTLSITESLSVQCQTQQNDRLLLIVDGLKEDCESIIDINIIESTVSQVDIESSSSSTQNIFYNDGIYGLLKGSFIQQVTSDSIYPLQLLTHANFETLSSQTNSSLSYESKYFFSGYEILNVLSNTPTFIPSVFEYRNDSIIKIFDEPVEQVFQSNVQKRFYRSLSKDEQSNSIYSAYEKNTLSGLGQLEFPEYADSSDLIVVKRDSNLHIEWELYFSAEYSFYSKYIQAISNDGCIITFSALKIGESEPFAGYLKVNSNGEIEQNYFGETIGLDETQPENHSFLVTYPNPGQMSVLIEGDYDVEIYTFSGKFIKKRTTNELIELPSGKHYVFLVKNADNVLHSGKSFIR